jgi:hypothetical protein
MVHDTSVQPSYYYFSAFFQFFFAGLKDHINKAPVLKKNGLRLSYLLSLRNQWTLQILATAIKEVAITSWPCIWISQR